jgi:hypothetical protein
VTPLGLITNPTCKLENPGDFKGAILLRSNGTTTILVKNAIEWVFWDNHSNDVSLIISVGNNGVKTVPVATFYEQNPKFPKLTVKLEGNHEGCRAKLLKAGVNVI